MKFLIIRKADEDTEAGKMPSRELLDAMMAYNQELERAGAFVQGVGLQASSMGARVRFGGGAPVVLDGPFTETKELIAGFTMIDVASKEEAIAWVKRWPAVDHPGEIEIRRVFEPEDFGVEAASEIHAQEARLRAGKR